MGRAQKTYPTSVGLFSLKPPLRARLAARRGNFRRGQYMTPPIELAQMGRAQKTYPTSVGLFL
ncbi:MAG: hypothetical protein A2X18_04525 [Bacteroidetes bacterium GWF2_40_14]|nr:MAG: hypothetical protein A2X18_04525 [Bacteroidetes bacterium GWF2_40_14]